MATNKFYITAGLQVSKASGTVPPAGKNTFYIAAGLPPVYDAGEEPPVGARPWLFIRKTQIIGVNQ